MILYVELACVSSFNYCASLPCLNNALCVSNSNCTIACVCNPQNFGQFCQFTSGQNFYSQVSTVNLLLPPTANDIDFNLEAKPCITQAWQQANPQIGNFEEKHLNLNFFLNFVFKACPNGFEMIPTITDRCYLTKLISSSSLTKQVSDYDCRINGGYLVAIETQAKLSAIINWLNGI